MAPKSRVRCRASNGNARSWLDRILGIVYNLLGILTGEVVMPTVTLSSKNQITLPAELVRVLGLKAGDKLSVIQSGDHLAVFSLPENWVDYFSGSLKGVYGSTAEEVDRYITEERASWGTDDWMEHIEDLLAVDPDACQVVEALRRCPPYFVATANELRRMIPASDKSLIGQSGKPTNKVDAALERLVRVGAVRTIADPVAPKHRLVREVAQREQV